MSQKGLIQQVFSEAQAYKQLEDLESLVEKSIDQSLLAKVPIQPLFLAIQTAPTDLVAQALVKMTAEQRQAVSDLSLWNRDILDIENFCELIEAYAICGDEKIIEEFAYSHDFLLFLKGRINLHTFDAEDPVYPDHDYYFLTEDNQLLIEYGEDFEQVGQIKLLIKSLYSKLGVENAYSHLFKYISDVYSIMEEDAFEKKKSRLREYGFVDYYEALEFLGTFKTRKQIEKFIDKKQLPSPSLSDEQLSQAVHSNSLIGYKDISQVDEELAKVQDPKRLDFLRFHLLRFVNGTLALQDALKKGKTQISEANRKTEKFFLLGFSFLFSEFNKREQDQGKKTVAFFDVYDFFDCYKIGNSLIGIEQKKLQKSLKETIFSEQDYFYFLGETLVENIQNSQKVSLYPTEYIHFSKWQEKLSFASDILTYIQKFYEVFQELKVDGKLQSQFYKNYELEDIDFEAIILSSFVHHYLGHYEDQENSKKMGISQSELIEFSKFLELEYQLKLEASIQFSKKFGLSQLEGTQFYLLNLIEKHLEGYDFYTMEDSDFRHVGGPIILNI